MPGTSGRASMGPFPTLAPCTTSCNNGAVGRVGHARKAEHGPAEQSPAPLRWPGSAPSHCSVPFWWALLSKDKATFMYTNVTFTMCIFGTWGKRYKEVGAPQQPHYWEEDEESGT